RRPLPSWAERCLTRLEDAGAAWGHPRHPSETVSEYAAAIERLAPHEEQFDRLAALMSRAAFSGRALADDQRRWVEHVLDELAPPKRRVLNRRRTIGRPDDIAGRSKSSTMLR
ncbi:MAG TPA: DUF4129 domain-containing protein, partial [Acidimicrobiales bacterium]|nr:DUF4129 domain-containing protein [Acidimicrobiales bacterium]